MTVTRRDWKVSFAGHLREGDYLLAVDTGNRLHGRPIALIRLTADPTYEPLADIPDSDFDAEGLSWLVEHKPEVPPIQTPFPSFEKEAVWKWFERWRNSGGRAWVIRFELLMHLDDLPPAKAREVAYEYVRQTSGLETRSGGV